MRGEVDVTIHMITHGLFIEALTQSIYSWNVLTLSNKVHTFHYCIHSNNEIKQCTASVNMHCKKIVKMMSEGTAVSRFINPQRACAVRVTVLGLCVCVSVTQHLTFT